MGMGFADMSKVDCKQCGKEVFNKLAVLLDKDDKYSEKFCTTKCRVTYIYDNALDIKKK